MQGTLTEREGLNTADPLMFVIIVKCYSVSYCCTHIREGAIDIYDGTQAMKSNLHYISMSQM
jgi:hypothetical protein